MMRFKRIDYEVNGSYCRPQKPTTQEASRDHNTKRAKLSIDVCAMFVAAKAIFSNFDIARARVQTIEFDF